MKEWKRRPLLKYLRAQEKLVSSDKGLFLIQTSLECLSLGGRWRENELSRVGPANRTGLAGISPPNPFSPYMFFFGMVQG
jgi:hypothetical protein